MHRILSSCLFSIALACPINLAALTSPVQAGGSEASSQARVSDAISDFSAQRGQGNRRPNAQRPSRRPPAAHRPARRPPVAHRPPRRPSHVHRPPVHGSWVRPRRYSWRPGGAIAAGAALGFVAAASAASWAGPPPSSGLCWYYTDWTQRQGFWDFCP
jgi:hypothetical protein